MSSSIFMSGQGFVSGTQTFRARHPPTTLRKNMAVMPPAPSQGITFRLMLASSIAEASCRVPPCRAPPSLTMKGSLMEAGEGFSFRCKKSGGYTSECACMRFFLFVSKLPMRWWKLLLLSSQRLESVRKSSRAGTAVRAASSPRPHL